jgi:hypothetical protein
MEVPELYAVARKLAHDAGLPYTDPRTGKTSQPGEMPPAQCPRCGNTDKGTMMTVIEEPPPTAQAEPGRDVVLLFDVCLLCSEKWETRP